MKRMGLYPAAALLAALFCAAPQPAAGWTWNPFAKKADSQAAKAAAKRRDSDKAATDAIKLKQTARAASKADKAAAKRTPTVAGKPVWSPVSDRYRWDAAQKQPTATRRALTSTVNTITLKPLRDKLSGNPMANRNPWSSTPPVTNTSSQPRQGMFGSLFKPKPKAVKKTGPQTVGEWIAQDRPGF
jgi:hypothetical protein